jgi:AhpD family alkylhydroperoxidase
VGGGFYDRPNAPAPGVIKASFSKQDFLNGLFPAKISITLLCLSLLAAALDAPFDSLASGDARSANSEIRSLDALNQLARQRVTARARVALPAETDAVFSGIDSLEADGRMPNYLRALTNLPNMVKPFATAFKTYLFGGTIIPEIKMAMGLRIAQLHGSCYAATHMQRLLGATPRGAQMLEKIRNEKLDQLSAAETLALRYGSLLTMDAHGVSDADFEKVHGIYNDSQIVELTMTTCFFNYFNRYCEALNLPVEAWALDPSVKPRLPVKPGNPLTAARVALISDDEIKAVVAANEAAKTPANNWNIGIANSQRAMMRAPDIQAAWRAAAWRGYNGAETAIDRNIQLQISFAVSMANGCRYCLLHQALGLRRIGVDPAKLVAMKKNDDALTPREKIAVDFARKLTRDVTSITDADYAALKAEFQERGALEALLQTCNFAYMNRFTDGLRLPSEDEAVRVYREIYGGEFDANSNLN